MATYTIKIDKRNKAAKSFLELIKNLPFIEIVENKPAKAKTREEIHYNPEFVRKIKKAEKRGEYTEINTDDVWGSLGLKSKN